MLVVPPGKVVDFSSSTSQVCPKLVWQVPHSRPLAVSGTSMLTPCSAKNRKPLCPLWHFEQLASTSPSLSQWRAASLAPSK